MAPQLFFNSWKLSRRVTLPYYRFSTAGRLIFSCLQNSLQKCLKKSLKKSLLLLSGLTLAAAGGATFIRPEALFRPSDDSPSRFSNCNGFILTSPRSSIRDVRSFSTAVGEPVQDIRARQPDQKVTVVKKTDEQLMKELKKLIKSRKVVLFMKGSPENPQCGFSRQIVQILVDIGCSDFTYVDVLRSERIRDLIKKHTGWPTIPQLFINGEFVGGCDVVTVMSTSGELRELLAKHGVVFEEADAKTSDSENEVSEKQK